MTPATPNGAPDPEPLTPGEAWAVGLFVVAWIVVGAWLNRFWSTT